MSQGTEQGKSSDLQRSGNHGSQGRPVWSYSGGLNRLYSFPFRSDFRKDLSIFSYHGYRTALPDNKSCVQWFMFNGRKAKHCSEYPPGTQLRGQGEGLHFSPWLLPCFSSWWAGLFPTSAESADQRGLSQENSQEIALSYDAICDSTLGAGQNIGNVLDSRIYSGLAWK